jgi:hypothetical protein
MANFAEYASTNSSLPIGGAFWASLRTQGSDCRGENNE